MVNQIVAFLIFLFLPFLGICQKIDHLVSYRNINELSYLRISYDNDYFDSSDENYTQGYNFEWVSPVLRKNPLTKLLVGNKSKNAIFGLSFEHIGFTPENIKTNEIQFMDRPFCAAMMLKSFVIVKHKSKKTHLVSSLNIGVMGPVAFGKEMQTGIHKAIGGVIPLGWQNQIKNDLVINYNFTYEKELLRHKKLLVINATANLKIGTLFTNASFGFNAKLDLFNNKHDKKKVEFYLFTEPLLYLIAYDASLQGGVLRKDNVYTVSVKNTKRLVKQFNFGLVLKIKKLYLEYSRTFISKEFQQGEKSGWGGLKFGVAF